MTIHEYTPQVGDISMTIILRATDDGNFTAILSSGEYNQYWSRDETGKHRQENEVRIGGHNDCVYEGCSSAVADAIVNHYVTLEDTIRSVSEIDKQKNMRIISAIAKLSAAYRDQDRMNTKIRKFILQHIRLYEAKALANLQEGT